MLLSREQLCGYLGVCAATLAKVCPVAPVDLGANVVRWNRTQIDAWIGGLPPRLRGDSHESHDEPVAAEPAELAGDERRSNAVERALARAKGTPCRKSRSSNASSGQTAA